MGAAEPDGRDVVEARTAHLFRRGRKSLLILVTESSTSAMCKELRLAVMRALLWRGRPEQYKEVAKLNVKRALKSTHVIA